MRVRFCLLVAFAALVSAWGGDPDVQAPDAGFASDVAATDSRGVPQTNLAPPKNDSNDPDQQTPRAMLALVGAALLAILSRGWKVNMRLAVNERLFSAQILKLIASDHRDRAIKLCQVVPHAPYVRLVLALLEAEGWERQTVFEAHQKIMRSAALSGRKLTLLGVGVLIVASAVTASAGWTDGWMVFAAAAFGVLLWAQCERRATRITKAGASMGEEIRQALDMSFG